MRLQGWLGTDSCFSETADVLVTERCFYAGYKESYNELQLRTWTKLWFYVQSWTDKGRTVSSIYWHWEERQGKRGKLYGVNLLSPGEQPASRTCPPCGSCLGRKSTAECNAGDPCPGGWTAGGRNDNSRCCRLVENPAILDGRTHCLQLNTIEKIVLHKYMFNWRKMLQKQLVWVSNTNTIFYPIYYWQ